MYPCVSRRAGLSFFSKGWKKTPVFFQSLEKYGRALLLLLALIPSFSSAQIFESFEYGVPPPGWTKINLLGGSGWYQLPIGVMPLPGWGNGTSGVPPTAGAGTHSAYCSWTTGGGASEGYHNDQWLISPQLNGLTATSKLSYWIKFDFTNFPDTVYARISTTGPNPASFTIVAYTNIFARGSWTGQFKPWTNIVINLGNFGIAPGTPIWIAIQEYEWDNTWNGAAVQLDVISSDLTAAPQPRASPTSLVFTAYYEGSDPAPQTFSIQSVGSSGMGFSRNLVFGAGPTDWLTMGGPSSGTLAFQSSQTFTATVSVAGLDLGAHTATNMIAVPGATNSPLWVPITFNVIRRPQAIAFPNPGAQLTTNRIGLAGTASSGLPVTFSVYSGPGSVTGATNLSFTGTGVVRVIAWQLGNVYYDMAPCITNSITVTRAVPVIYLTDLNQMYDGTPKPVTVATAPTGLPVTVTYNGGSDAPVNAGSYTVNAVVDTTLYYGSSNRTLVIAKATQTVNFAQIPDQETTNQVGLAATASTGLPVTFSIGSGPGVVNGTNLTFTGAGAVSVVASQAGDINWAPATVTNWLTVTKAAATVALGDLSHVYDGSPHSATATTDPSGLSVVFTYNGSAGEPIGAGSYAVTGTVNDAIYQGSSVDTLTVSKADQAITFPVLQPRLTNAVVALGASEGLPVTEFAVVSGPGLVVGTNLTFSGAGDVLVRASQSGDANWNPAVPVTNLVKAFSVNPLSGPAAGGNIVTIFNGALGNVTNVLVCEVPVTILDQGTNWVSVQCGAGTPGTGDLVIQSDSDIVVSNAYTVNPAGTIIAVAPDIGSYVGGYPVVLAGSNLCDGTDVTNVTLCGIAATVVSQSPTQIVVVAGVADPGHMGTGDVRVCSVSFGETVKSNAFAYAIADMNILGTNGATIANAEPADAVRGTDFGSQLVLGAYTNWFVITNSAEAALNILGVSTNGSDFFAVRSMPASVSPGSGAAFVIVYTPAAVGSHSAEIVLANDSTNTPFVINLAGTAIKRNQDALIFTPASPQAYNTTNTLVTSGGSGTGAVSYAVQDGPGEIVGDDGLKMLAGAGTVTVVATKAGDSLYNAYMTASFVTAAKAEQPAIVFTPDSPQTYLTTNTLAATGGAGTGAFSYEIVSGPGEVVNTDGLRIASGTGTVLVRATKAGDADWMPASVTGSVVAARADQTINFPAIADQAITNKVGLAATASSGLSVSFGMISGPAVLSGGTNLSFTGTGVVSVAASQAGDGNWQTAGVVRVFSVYPLPPIVENPFHANAEASVADMGGSIVNLFGANATRRGLVWSTTPGFDPATASNAIEVGDFGTGVWTQHVAGLVSGVTNHYRAYAVSTGGTGYTAEAWVHMKPEAPAAVAASDLRPDSFLANWQAARGATNYLLDVSDDEAFGTFVPGYENCVLGDVLAKSVTGLVTGVTYHYRLRAENQAGVSTNSLVIHAMPGIRLTILTWPRAAGQTIPAQGTYIVDYSTPTQVVTWANAGYRFVFWEGTGGIAVADSLAPTTSVSLLMTSVLTAYYQQPAGIVTWTYTKWVTNYGLAAIVGTAQVCNNSTNGTRLAAPFWYCVQSNATQRLRFPTGTDPVSGWPYLDVSTQMTAALPDGILDPGECVTVTNIAFYVRSYKQPSNIVWHLSAVELSAANRVDTDGDLMPDEYENAYSSILNPLSPLDASGDPDGDRMRNDEECISGTDPTNCASFFALDEIGRQAGVGNRVCWPSASGRVYRVFGATNPLSDYLLLHDNIPATPPMNVFTDGVFGAGVRGFYRIDVENR